MYLLRSVAGHVIQVETLSASFTAPTTQPTWHGTPRLGHAGSLLATQFDPDGSVTRPRECVIAAPVELPICGHAHDGRGPPNGPPDFVIFFTKSGVTQRRHTGREVSK
ncbi:MAG: hypothetical protein EB145_05960 [Proteobacteria bacterium]|nr:hypothetical protein [Pseudomonadota bacterium]NBT04169.1 hypothetical protein [Pseudomonadota bacterium]NBT19837.1 hypothetical protein [Pseudomonadota bacterium]NDF53720.1 hypothetical protein [Pseudomonadota bacterium]